MNATPPGPPLWLLAELTYRCPLHCAFCYNQVDFALQADELGTDNRLGVLADVPEKGKRKYLPYYMVNMLGRKGSA